jgi:HK97 gp10 family phage protein
VRDTVHVKGLSELQKFLNELPPKLERNVVRGALRAGANVIKPVAQANIHSVSGDLARSLKVSTRARGGVVTAKVYTSIFYAKFVEYGTKPHVIKAKDGGALAFGGGVVQSVQHPGISPKPFLRPALDTQASAAVVAAGSYMRDRLATKHGLDTADIEIEEAE